MADLRNSATMVRHSAPGSRKLVLRTWSLSCGVPAWSIGPLGARVRLKCGETIYFKGFLEVAKAERDLSMALPARRVVSESLKDEI